MKHGLNQTAEKYTKQEAYADSNFLQSSEWADTNYALNSAVPSLQTCSGPQGETARALCFKRKLVLSGKKTAPLVCLYECADGPLLKTADASLLKCILKKILLKSRLSLAVMTRINLGPINKLNNFKQVLEIFEELGFSASKWGTYLTNLECGEDELFKSINQKGRNKVRKGTKNGLVFKEISSIEDFIEKSMPVYNDSGIKDISAEKMHYYFRPELKNSYAYYLVQDAEGRNLATAGSYFHNGVATRIASAISPLCYREKIPAQDFLTWNALLDAQKKGCTTFDMAGVNPDPQTTKEKNIKSFKSKWGGEYTEYFLFEKDMIPFAKQLKLILKKLRNNI